MGSSNSFCKQYGFYRSAVFALVALSGLAGCTSENLSETVHKSVDEQQSAFEREQDFNFGWSFWLSGEEDVSNVDMQSEHWRSVRLPHDWSVEHEFDESLDGATAYLPGGIGWYKKTFTTDLDINSQMAFLQFDGIYNHSDVWLNGHRVGGEVNGYTPFNIDLTPHLAPLGQENTVIVKVDRSRYIDSRWYTGSGIYRDVKLVTVDKLHIPIWGAYVTTPVVEADKGLVDVEISVANQYDQNNQFELTSTIFKLDKSFAKAKVVATKTANLELANNVSSVFKSQLTVASPELWDIDKPALYLVTTDILKDGNVVDSYSMRFGFRNIEFNADTGFFLNGKSVKIKGVNIHHAAGLVGAAVPKDVWKRRLLTLKEGGTNAIRMAHNPASQELMDLCDELGLLVQAEIFDEWDNPKDKRLNQQERHDDYISRGYADYFQTHAEADLKAAVKRDRNHPSLIMWSIGNEIEWTYPRYAKATGYFDMNASGNYFHNPPFISPEEIKKRFHDSEEGEYVLAKTAKKLSAWVKELDQTRPVTANLILPSVSHITGYTDALDIIGYSYRRVIYDYGHRLFPDKMIMGTENVVQWHEWKAVMERDFIAGTFLWTGIDYMGEAHGGWPRKVTPSGMLDIAGFDKPSFHMMKTLWNDAPHVKIFTQTMEKSPYKVGDDNRVQEKKADAWKQKIWVWHDVNRHWNYDNNQLTSVEVYSNCDAVELFVNDKSFGKQSMADNPDRILKWAVNYEAGDIVAKGLGQCQTEDKIVTASQPSQLVAKSDQSVLTSGGYDIAHIEVQLSDDNGNPVTHTESTISVSVPTGIELMGVDNGSGSSVQPYQSNQITTFEGRALIIVRADQHADLGQIKLLLAGDELKPTEVLFDIVQTN